MDIQGLLASPKYDVSGEPYQGRLTLRGIQWTGTDADSLATLTLTAEQIADAIENHLVWTDQSVQRGVLPSAPKGTPKDLAVADGYPDRRLYAFDSEKADDITEKLLRGDRLFLNPLVWNLRPGEFEAYRDVSAASLFLYSGRIYLPDSHHRHQAILKAVRTLRDHPSAYKRFSVDRQFKVELYFLDKEGEGNYFFDKNQRPKPVANSKAYDLTTADDLSVLAKRVIDKSPSLTNGVNRVTDRLSKKSAHFITLSTLREMMKTFAGNDEFDDAELEGLAIIAAEFFEMLSEIRPELRPRDSQYWHTDSLAAAAVVMHGYATLMNDYSTDVAKLGLVEARALWQRRLQVLSRENYFEYEGWSGDFFSRENPIWYRIGVLKLQGAEGRITTSNTGGTRSRVGQLLHHYVTEDMRNLALIYEAQDGLFS